MRQLLRFRDYCAEIGCICCADEAMAAHTTFKIGGPADLLVRPRDETEASLVIRKAKELELPLIYIGKGSNLLVSDDGIRGIVIAFDESAAKPVLRQDDKVIDCPAGTSLSALCVFAQRHGLSGLEFAYGIPGSVGGAIYMNAGAYGGEMKDVVIRVHYLDGNGQPHELSATDLDMGYRHSWFADHPDCLIIGGSFQLQQGEPEVIRARMDELMHSRVSKQPLEYPSAGSTFKRPQGAYASALIDQCGLKGFRVGGAMVSEKHAGFVINYDGATCADVRKLVDEIKRIVWERTGYRLECEIKIL